MDRERPFFVTEESRQQITKFLAELMRAVQAREWEDNARLSAFGMTTLLTAHFPGLIAFLKECLVKDDDTKCLEGTVDVERFMFHLAALKVCFFFFQESSCFNFRLGY